SADFLGIDLPGEEGPVEVAGEYVRLRFDARDLAIARRTGPVSATVVTVAPPGAPQHAGDKVVFDPAPLGEVEDGELLTFPAGTGVAEGPRRAYPSDGVRPADDIWNAFHDALAAEGWVLEVRSNEAYELEVDGAPRPAIYGWLAVPDAVSDAAAHARLRELTA